MQTAQNLPVRPTGFGLAALVLSGLALATVLIALVAGPFHKSPELGVTLGELAGDIAKNSVREFFGLKRPAPEAPPEALGWTIDKKIAVGVIVTGILGIILATISYFRGERWQIATIASVLGGCAIALQVLSHILIIVLGTLILIAFLGSLTRIFSLDFFSGFSS